MCYLQSAGDEMTQNSHWVLPKEQQALFQRSCQLLGNGAHPKHRKHDELRSVSACSPSQAPFHQGSSGCWQSQHPPPPTGECAPCQRWGLPHAQHLWGRWLPAAHSPEQLMTPHAHMGTWIDGQSLHSLPLRTGNTPLRGNLQEESLRHCDRRHGPAMRAHQTMEAICLAK